RRAGGLQLAAVVDRRDVEPAIELVPGLLRYDERPETLPDTLDPADVVDVSVRQDDRLERAIAFAQGALEHRHILGQPLAGVEQQPPPAGADQVGIGPRSGEWSG